MAPACRHLGPQTNNQSLASICDYRAELTVLYEDLCDETADSFGFDLAHSLDDLDDMQDICMGRDPLERAAAVKTVSVAEEDLQSLRDLCMGR